jgi:hypothetical protein
VEGRVAIVQPHEADPQAERGGWNAFGQRDLARTLADESLLRYRDPSLEALRARLGGPAGR